MVCWWQCVTQRSAEILQATADHPWQKPCKPQHDGPSRTALLLCQATVADRLASAACLTLLLGAVQVSYILCMDGDSTC